MAKMDGLPLHIELLLIPPRAPELNPIEKIRQWLVQLLKKSDLFDPRPHKDAPALYAYKILSQFTHTDIGKCYMSCGYLPENTYFEN